MKNNSNGLFNRSKEDFIVLPRGEREKYLPKSISVIYPSFFWKKTMWRLPFISFFFSIQRDYSLGCIIAQNEKKRGLAIRIARLTSRQTIVDRRERINYCPLTVLFPAPEFPVSSPGGIHCNIQFHAPFLRSPPPRRRTIIVLWLPPRFSGCESPRQKNDRQTVGN